MAEILAGALEARGALRRLTLYLPSDPARLRRAIRARRAGVRSMKESRDAEAGK